MTKDDSKRIQSTQEYTGKGSFASRAQSAGDKHENAQTRWLGMKLNQASNTVDFKLAK